MDKIARLKRLAIYFIGTGESLVAAEEAGGKSTGKIEVFNKKKASYLIRSYC